MTPVAMPREHRALFQAEGAFERREREREGTTNDVAGRVNQRGESDDKFLLVTTGLGSSLRGSPALTPPKGRGEAGGCGGWWRKDDADAGFDLLALDQPAETERRWKVSRGFVAPSFRSHRERNAAFRSIPIIRNCGRAKSAERRGYRCGIPCSIVRAHDRRAPGDRVSVPRNWIYPL